MKCERRRMSDARSASGVLSFCPGWNAATGLSDRLSFLSVQFLEVIERILETANALCRRAQLSPEVAQRSGRDHGAKNIPAPLIRVAVKAENLPPMG